MARHRARLPTTGDEEILSGDCKRKRCLGLPFASGRPADRMVVARLTDSRSPDRPSADPNLVPASLLLEIFSFIDANERAGVLSAGA